MSVRTFSARYRPSIFFGSVSLVLLALLASLTLDMGESGIVLLYTTITYAALIWMILLRRPAEPTAFDLIALRWTPVILYFFGLTFFPFIWHLRDHS